LRSGGGASSRDQESLVQARLMAAPFLLLL
jgi:hypothetical protein